MRLLLIAVFVLAVAALLWPPRAEHVATLCAAFAARLGKTMPAALVPGDPAALAGALLPGLLPGLPPALACAGGYWMLRLDPAAVTPEALAGAAKRAGGG